MTLRIGLMQGRLTPPKRHPIQEFPEAWEQEFPAAGALGFDAIEFIFGGPQDTLPSHPLLEPGLTAIRRQVERSGVEIVSICADHFMAEPLHRGDRTAREASRTLLEQLISQAGALGVTDIVLPCVDDAALRGIDDEDALLQALGAVEGVCERAEVRLALELDLPPQGVRRLLERADSPWIRVNFDAGNSAALGYDSTEEWETYGEHVSSVHIKDRRLHGGTVPLGTGAVQFDRFFTGARKAGYSGLLTIQGARGSDHIAIAAGYRHFVEELVLAHYGVDAYRSRVAR